MAVTQRDSPLALTHSAVRIRRFALIVCTLFVLVLQLTHAHDVVFLVGAYGFSEGTGLTSVDASGNSNTATLANGATWAPGKYGFGVSLDGVNDFISVPN